MQIIFAIWKKKLTFAGQIQKKWLVSHIFIIRWGREFNLGFYSGSFIFWRMLVCLTFFLSLSRFLRKTVGKCFCWSGKSR